MSCSRASSHPLLRPADQPNPRREHRAYPCDARSAAHPDRCHQGRQRQGFDRRSARRTESPRATLPLLRQPHAHHRDLLAGATAKAPPNAAAFKDQDRHLMRRAPVRNTRICTLHPCWLSSHSADPRTATPAACAITTQKTATSLRKTPPRVHAPNHAYAARKNASWCRCVSSPAPTSPRPNPHSACGTTAAHNRDFVPCEGFRTRPPQRGDSPSCRRPETCTAQKPTWGPNC
jgi:hypothetical protein